MALHNLSLESHENISTLTIPNDILQGGCPREVPSSYYYLKSIAYNSTGRMSMFSVFGTLCAFTFLVYIFEIVSMLRNKMHIMRRIRMVMLLSLYPVYSSLAFLAIMVPRAAPLLDLVANVYFTITLWNFIKLIMMYYGGEKKMIEEFAGAEISIQVPPVCCCLCCLPKFQLTKKFLLKLKLGAAQFLVIRPVLLVISMILWVEDMYEYRDPATGKMQPFRSASTYIALVNMVTTLLAMWPLIVIFRASLQRLAHFHIRGKFLVFQLVMVFGSLQDAILTQLANFSVLPCSPYLPVRSYALEIHHLAIVGEMFVLSMAALRVYWRYIRENIPLDFHYPTNGHALRQQVNDDDVESPEGTGSDDVCGDDTSRLPVWS